MLLDHQKLGVRVERNILYYTCKFPVGHYVYPLINVGGPRIIGAKTQVEKVTITHQVPGGVKVEYKCTDGITYTNESELCGSEIQAMIVCRERNRLR